MPRVRIGDQLVEVGADDLFADDGSTPLNIPTGQVFTTEDIEKARSQERDKLYGRIDDLKETVTGLKNEVGTLTSAQKQQLEAAQAEQARLEEEARRQAESGLDPADLINQRTSEWQQQLAQVNQTWEQRFGQERQQREAAEALAAREREFSNLREYTLAQVDAHKDKIAPELIPWISGNTQEEIDSAIARAVNTTDAIAAQFEQVVAQQQAVPGQQQVAPPALPGTRATGGPANTDPAGQVQTLTAEQIASMPMDAYAKLRGQLGIGGQGNNRGMFG